MSAVRFTVSGAREVALIDQALPLDDGHEVQSPRIAYELHGPANAPVVAVLGGISAHAHVASSARDRSPGWWEAFVGTDGAVGPQWRVLSFDFLGGVGHSSAVGEEGFAGGEPWPRLTTGDQARVLARLLDHLEIPQLHGLVGSSYGGMVGLAFAAEHAARLRHLVALSAPARSHGQAAAWRRVQRQILQLAVKAGCGAEGVRIARQLGLSTYRTEAELGARFESLDDLNGWLDHHGEAFAQRCTPEAYHALCWSLDLHEVDATRVTVPTTVVASRTDRLVPFDTLEQLAADLPQARFVAIDSAFGHDAFLKDVDAVSDAVRTTLEESA